MRFERTARCEEMMERLGLWNLSFTDPSVGPGLSFSEYAPLAAMFADVRSLRIGDGPDEVHKMAIAKRELRRQAALRAELSEATS